MGSRKPGFAENFVFSGAAAIIAKTATAPIDRVKLLLQNQDEIIKAGRMSKPYKGAIDCTVRTFRTEGILPFWRGNLANLLRYFPTQALNFALKDEVKALFKSAPNESYAMKVSKNILSGGVAGILSFSFVYSLGYAHTRLATDVKFGGKGSSERQFSGLINVYTKTFKSDGIVGLHRGFVISCVGITVYRGLYFGLYDSLKPLMLGENASIPMSYCLGFVVSVTSGLLCYPMDTIRSRMMMRSGQAVKYKGSIDCAMQIIKNEGFMSLMKGAGVSIIGGVAGALMLTLYDRFKTLYAPKQ